MKVSRESGDPINDKIEQIRKIIPECFTEKRLDVDKLTKLFTEKLNIEDEKYTFSWAGKNSTIQNTRTSSKGSLIPEKDESVNFEDSDNIFIEGENLEVLKLLRRSYYGKIKMIYVDPPYNTGHDFIYHDDFKNSIQSYLEQTGQTQNGIKLTSNPQTSGRFHSDWISFMFSRLSLARDFLTEDGVIFVSIGDEEVHNLRNILDDVFGEENFQGHIHWRRRHNQPNDPTKMIAIVGEHILVFAKNNSYLKQVGVGKIGLTGSFSNPDNDPRGDWSSKPWKVGSGQTGTKYSITTPTGKIYDEEWMGDTDTFQKLSDDKRIIFTNNGNGLPRKKYFKTEREKEGQVATNWWNHDYFGSNQDGSKELSILLGAKNVFDNPKPTKLLKNILDIANCHDGDIVMDFFAGSCSLADAVLQRNFENSINSKFIVVQIPETLDESNDSHDDALEFLKKIKKPFNISEIGKERIRRVIKKINDEKNNSKTNLKIKLDLGFKILKLSKSNFKIWENYTGKDEKKLKEQMKLFESQLIDNYVDEHVIYECIIKEGYDLNSKIEIVNIESNKIYNIVGDSSFYLCLDKIIQQNSIDKIFLSNEDTFICIDASLTDSLKTNLAKQCTLKTM